MSIQFINNEYVAENEAKISIFDRSYLFGEGLFESFRSYGNGKIPLLQKHLNRLEWSCTFLGLPYPMLNFKDICQTLLKKNNLKDARFKIVVSQNESLEGSDLSEQSNITIFCLPLVEKNIPQTYKLKTLSTLVNDALPLSSVKTTNYLVKAMGRKEAKEFGCDDGILLNHKGFVTEGTSTNIFWIDKDNKLHTVLPEQGLLPGVMKQTVLDLLKEKNLKIKESLIKPDELSSSREVFVTNSLIGIKPVVEIDGRKISGGECGPVTEMISELWTNQLKEWT